jgi:glycosyltransferase involved in cell wall biosynthesis
MGIPYITARTEGVAEILTDGENCLMVNKGDAKDLAEKILKLKNDPGLAKKLAEKGRVLYEKEFTPKILAGKILNYIAEIPYS